MRPFIFTLARKRSFPKGAQIFNLAGKYVVASVLHSPVEFTAHSGQ